MIHKTRYSTFNLALLSVLALSTIYFRLSKLGYSNFQGDEVKAHGFIFTKKSFVNFLLTNSKGPGQYIISRITYIASEHNMHPELTARIPYAVAGILTTLILYILLKKYLDKRTAIISTFLTALSGMLIAFSRIAQYQSFILLGSIITVLFTLNYIKFLKKRYLILAGITSFISLLFHFDALSFIIPTFLILMLNSKTRKGTKWYIALTLLAGIFYIPYVFTNTFTDTFKYLYHGRILTQFSYDSIYYGIKLMTLYHPKEYLIFLLAGTLLWLYNVIRHENKFYKGLVISIVFLLLLRYITVHPRRIFIYTSTLLWITFSIIYIRKFFTTKRKVTPIFFIEVWFLFSFLIYAVFFKKPLTHIYNFIIPATIISSFQFKKLYEKHKYAVIVFITVALISSISFNYQAFIDNDQEYPWVEKKYIFGKMYTGVANGEKVRGMFGFPYYRSLETLKGTLNEINVKRKIKNYTSNEGDMRMRYYIQEFSNVSTKPYYYIYIKNNTNFDKTQQPRSNPLTRRKNFTIYLME